MKKIINPILTMCLGMALLTSCDKDMGSMEVPFEPYVLSSRPSPSTSATRRLWLPCPAKEASGSPFF